MQLSQSDLLQLFEYRPDGQIVWKKNGKIAGSAKEYHQTMVNGTLYGTHRLIFLMHHGYLPEEIDHVNRDPLDNRIENLRASTSSQNKMNRRGWNGHKNVYWHKQHNKWMVKVGKKFGGYFKNLEEAKIK